MGALMGGAEISSMDTGKYMLRMVRRGLLRSPIKGFRTMRKTMENVRTGPGGRRSG